MKNNYRESPFYSGATGYGGSSAFAKRREAARRTFFANNDRIKKDSSRSLAIGVPVHSYKIDTDNIIRKEPSGPQLSSQARKILSWIEESSAPSRDMAPLTKRHRTINRFTPTPYIPPRSNRFMLQKNTIEAREPVSTIGPAGKAPVPVLAPVLAPNLPPAPPTSDRFTSAKFVGPLTEVQLSDCKSKTFVPPKDLEPKQKVAASSPTTKPTPIINFNDSMAAPTPYIPPRPNQFMSQKNTIEAREPVSTIGPAGIAPVPVLAPVLAPNLPPAPPTSDESTPAKFVVPPTEVKLSDCESKNFVPPKDPEPKQKVAASSPITKPTPTFNFNFSMAAPTPYIPPRPNQFMSQKNTIEAREPVSTIGPAGIAPVPVLAPVLAPNLPPAPPTSDRFTSAKFVGPLTEVQLSDCKSKTFVPPRDLDPKHEVAAPSPITTPSINFNFSMAAPTPKAATPTAPAKILSKTPVASPAPVIPPVPAITSVPSQAPTPAPTVTQTPAPESASNPVSAPKPDQYFDMDVEMDPTHGSPAVAPIFSFGQSSTQVSSSQPTLSTQTPALAAPTTPLSTPAPILGTPTTSLATQAPTLGSQTPTIGTHAPTLGTQAPSSIFMPNFSMPAFTSPVPSPQPIIQSPGVNAASPNPFQPTNTAVRGRKILRPVRRLHR